MKKLLLILLLCVVLLFTGNIIYTSLPTVYYYESGEVYEIIKETNYFFPLRYTDPTTVRTYYYKNGNIMERGESLFWRKIGKWENYYENGQLGLERNYKKFTALGGGKTTSFIKSKLISQKCWDENGNNIDCSSISFFEIMKKTGTLELLEGPGMTINLSNYRNPPETSSIGVKELWWNKRIQMEN